MANGYPETCEKPVIKVSEALHVDNETAYTVLALYAVLTDLSTQDEALLDMVLSKAAV